MGAPCMVWGGARGPSVAAPGGPATGWRETYAAWRDPLLGATRMCKGRIETRSVVVTHLRPESAAGGYGPPSGAAAGVPCGPGVRPVSARFCSAGGSGTGRRPPSTGALFSRFTLLY
ncbi:hypothetical protein GCM10018779_12390 [Streptomyces griseocarneus]|nr:hypothetical protein GCM10018779_12390 [Streptomyces griseocarneus]